MQVATLMIVLCFVYLHQLWQRQPPVSARQRQKSEAFGLDFTEAIKQCGANCTRDEVITLASEQVLGPTHDCLLQSP